MSIFDRSSVLKAANEDLEQAKFKLTNKSRIAVRVGNDQDSPIFVSPIDAPVEEDVSVFDDAPAVVKEILTEIVSYIVPPNKFLLLDQITCSGENIAYYKVSINANTNKIKRAGYGTSFNVDFKYNSYKVETGQTIAVEVYHYNDMLGDFSANIEGRLYAN